MEQSEETVSKESSVNGKDEQLSMLETNVQKSPEKKKFCNTVFATKMRNRRKEEKLKEIDTADVLTNCKGKSIDVKRINPEAVPKLITAVGQKHRRRKRWNRWKLGMAAKKKKPAVKSPKKEEVRVETDKSMYLNFTKKDQKNSLELDLINSESSAINDDVQRRKSLRHLAPNVIPDQKYDSEIKTDKESIPKTEIFSCRRTELFIGKLNTRESRILNIEKLFGPVSQNNNKSIENGNKDLTEKNEGKRTAFVSDANSSVKESKSFENKESENCRDAESFTKKGKSENKHKNKLKNRRTLGIADTEKELVNQESKNSSDKVNETKENIDEETSCRRTIPFEGKNIDKPPSGVPETSIDIACPNDVNIKLDSRKENVNTEQSSSSIDSNPKQNSSDVIHKKSKTSSSNVKAKSDSNLTSSDAKLKSSKDTDMSNEKSKSESSQVQNNTEMDSSIKDANTILDVLNKTGSILDETAKDHSMEVKEGDSSVEVKKLLNSSNETKTKMNVSNNINMKLDKLPDNTDSQSTESQFTDSENEDWSCSRTEPFVGKYYSHCSRTLPYVRPVNKVNPADAPGTSSDLKTNKNSKPESISNNRLVLSDADKSSSETNIPRNSESESVDCTAHTNLGSNSETLVQNGEWKFRRKRQKTITEDEDQVFLHN